MWMPGRKIVENMMREFMKKAPKETEIQLESQEIYGWLVHEGLSIGEGDMESIFNSFKREGLIRGVGFTGNSDDRKGTRISGLLGSANGFKSPLRDGAKDCGKI